MSVERKLTDKVLAAFDADDAERLQNGIWTTRCEWTEFVGSLGFIAWTGEDDDRIRPRILLVHRTGREYLATVVAGAFDPIIEITWNKGEVTVSEGA